METAQPQTQEIVDDFGPRLLGGASDWHSGIDYAVSGEVLSMEDGQIDGITWNGLITVRISGTSPGHIFRYLHMFRNSSTLPIDQGDFRLTTTDQGHLAIIRWTPGFAGRRADYVLARAVDYADTVSGILNAAGTAPAQVVSSVQFQQGIGPAGTSGGVALHLHVDLSNYSNEQLSQNPLLHIAHQPSNYSIKFLDSRNNEQQNGFIINADDTNTSFIKVRVDSGYTSTHSGKDLDKLEIYVDEQSYLGMIRKFSFGGLTPGHDPYHSDIENNGALDTGGEAVYFDGILNGIVPRSKGGLEDFVYTSWQSVGGPASPSNLADGEHNLIACWTNIREQTDCSTRMRFIIARIPPDLTINSPQETLCNVSGKDPQNSQCQNPVATDNHISAQATAHLAQVQIKNITVYGAETKVFQGASFANQLFPPKAWYWALACDAAQNCTWAPFGIFPPDPSNPPPPPPPPPPCPTGARCLPPPTLPDPLCTRGVNCPPPTPPPDPPRPPCLLASADPSTSLKGCMPVKQPLPPLPYKVPGDPNSMSGPQGSVTPGQLMTYTIEFENVGDGTALGVYIKDVLDPSLDDTILNLRDMHSLGFASDGTIISTTSANFPWSYDHQTRTMTLLAGNAEANRGGSFVLETRLKATATPGTIIPNQAFIYFPNALQQVTPTNSIISAVPLPTQLAYVGQSSGAYLGIAGLATRLSAGSEPIAFQPVGFQLLASSPTAMTDSSGIANASAQLSTAAGTYNLGLNYGGDGFYYLPSTANSNFTVTKRNTLLQAPYAASRPTDTVHLVLTITDDQGQALLNQSDEPKTIFLELMSTSSVSSPLASALLSGTSVAFQFSLPQPLQMNWTIRARFDGDSRYAASSSTGILSLTDDVPPTVAIISPHGGEIFAGANPIIVNFSVHDNADPAPAVSAYLVGGGQPVAVSNGAAIPASSLSPGDWTLTVAVTDWAGNVSYADSGVFQIASDMLSPQTSLSMGTPSYGVNPIFISSQTPLSLSAIDDRNQVGDGAGMGVAQTYYAVDGGSWTAYSVPFTIAQDGAHQVSFYSVDLAGNTENPPKTQNLTVDSTPPATLLLVNGLSSSATSLLLISTDSLSFATSDAGVGVSQILYTLDAATNPTVAVSSFTLGIGTHTIAFQAIDHLGNAESTRTVAVTVLSLDTNPPSIAVVPLDQSTVTLALPQIAASYADSGRGVDPTSVSLILDGVDVTTRSAVTASSVTFTPSAALSQGVHTVSAQVADFAGNRATAGSTFLVDSLPPVTALLVDGIATSATHLVLISTDSLGFSATDAGTGVAQTRYALDDTAIESVFGSTFSLSVGTHTIAFHSMDLAGNVEPTHNVSISVLLDDIIPPFVALSIADQSTVTTASPVIGAIYNDAGRGVETASVRLVLDGVDVTTQAVVTASSVTFTPALSQGTHLISISLADSAGNLTTVSSRFFVDSVPPVTRLLVNGLTASATSLVLISADTLGFAAADSGTGVAQTLYTLDGGTQAVFASTFSLTAGVHSLAYHSVDNAGNEEAVNTVLITVQSLPSGSVSARLDYPSPLAKGVEQAVGGIVDIRGETTGSQLKSWTLSVAVGSAATTGFNVIASGAANASGRLALWDTRTLSGYFTLKLSAVDTAGNASSALAVVFVGRPVMDFAIGRRHANAVVRVMDDPEGLVVRPDGWIWVTADDSRRIILVSSSGTVAATVGTNASGPFKFKHPTGLALDAANNLYVADRDNDRIAKLSPDGSQLLYAFTNGLQGPNDAAVDADGSVYVADTGHGRVRVFAANGTVLRDIQIPAQYGQSKPWGVALSSAGVWVSDRSQRTVSLFTRSGVLVKKLNNVGRVRGAAIDHGQALYIADRDNDRIDKFDPNGSLLLTIGPRGWGKGDDCPRMDFWPSSCLCSWRQAPWGMGFRPEAGYWMPYLSDPADAAISPDGALWVADSGHDRIVRYILPPAIAAPEGHKGVMGVADASADDAAAPMPVASKEPAARVVDPDSGGKVERDDGTSVRIPAGALGVEIQVTVAGAEVSIDAQAKGNARKTLNLAPASDEIAYGPEGTLFSSPVLLTLSYDPAQISANNLDEDHLKVHYWNPATAGWEALDSVVDKSAKTVSARTAHFSVYQVMGGGVSLAAASDNVALAQIACNPLRPNCRPMLFRNLPANARMRIYTLTGAMVKDINADSTGQASWDGTNQSGASVASGVYFIFAQGNGTEKTLKIAVER